MRLVSDKNIPPECQERFFVSPVHGLLSLPLVCIPLPIIYIFLAAEGILFFVVLSFFVVYSMLILGIFIKTLWVIFTRPCPLIVGQEAVYLNPTADFFSG